MPDAPGSPRASSRSAMTRAELLAAPLDELTARAAAVRDDVFGTRIDLLAQGLHPAHHVVPGPLRLLHLRQGPGPRRVPLPVHRRGPRHRPGGPGGRLPRGALHPGRRSRGPLPGRRRVAGRPRLRLHRRLPGRRLRRRPGGDRAAPPRQRRGARPGRPGPTAAGVGQPGDDDRVDQPRPGRPPLGPGQGAGPAAGHPGVGGRAVRPVHDRAAGGHRRVPRGPPRHPGGHRRQPCRGTATSRR